MSKAERWLLAVYAVVLLLLLPLQSLWLDELMEAVATRPNTLMGLLTGYALHSAGQSPLGSVEQWFSVHAFGFSNLTARLPAALSGILAIWGLLRLAKRTGVAKPWLCALLLATLPLQLRYVTEARPYSQAMCVSVWLTYFALELSADSTAALVSYFAILCIGLYTQPFVIFAAAAHVCWMISVNKRAALKQIIAAAVACLAYLPWYFLARGHWSQEVNAEDLHFHWQAKLPLLILRELLGSGYIGTMLALAFAAYAWRAPEKKPEKRLLLLTVLVPITLTVFADTAFDYFFAIRQVITVLPALVILIAYGLERVESRKLAVAAAVLFLLLNAGYSLRWFTKPREDWKRAAQTMAANIGPTGCFLPVPDGTASYYSFFRPDLTGRTCGTNLPGTVVVAVSPYVHDRSQPNALLTNLAAQGYAVTRLLAAPEIDICQRSGNSVPSVTGARTRN
jgi:hypothetical protein